MQRLTGLDATFLYMETSHNHMHVGGTCVFDPTTVPGGYSFEKVLALVESRLHLLPPFRRRLAEIPFQLHHPLWIEDPDFELEHHVRRVALPAPGDLDELARFSAEMMARPLDRRRPRWRATRRPTGRARVGAGTARRWVWSNRGRRPAPVGPCSSSSGP